MTRVRPDLPPMPERFERLPVSSRGFPVPWFVAWLGEDNEPMPRGEGTPDFRVLSPGAVAEAWSRERCWLCGERTGRYVAFVLGPMCAVNRVNSEPPSHRDCADYAARACPFLTRPHMKRRPTDFEGKSMPGNPILRNPGVAVVWITERGRPRPFNAGDGVLFNVGEPTEVRWYAEGRPATRAECEASIESGLPALQAEADAEGNGAPDALAQMVEQAWNLLPAETPAALSPTTGAA